MNDMTLNNNVRMPMIGFGTWDIRGEAGKQSILTALDLGYRLIDTAQMYENEYIVGCAVKESGIPREELFLTTKIYRPRTTYQKAKSGIEQSLNELQTDYIDLLLIHEPYKSAPEMYEAFKEALRDGKVRAIGISNFDAEKYKEFVRSCEIIPAVNQVESHVYFPQLELKNLLNSYGTQMQSWASFTEGRKNIFAEPVLKEIGARHGKTSGQIALRYLIQNGIAVIPKSVHRERMAENLAVLDFALTPSELSAISRLNGNSSLFGWY
ncbi:2,5-diketo-D-gluconic acid reductase [Sellimonas catena]|uniref:2,5-diketo-D-gluconic acid reductase n=2 Tax=Bacillota TaxID=1239 RepID=A0A9W6C7W5_9FIRM|nr:2,5-diketo-D-gluconic acid reductase [Sellimonas catena]